MSWNAEIPNLYDLLILKKEDDFYFSVFQPKGWFPKIRIQKRAFFFERKADSVESVVRYETDPDNGHVVSDSVMRLDIRRMKELNINTVITYYPQKDYWYQLCNHYGIYVIENPILVWRIQIMN